MISKKRLGFTLIELLAVISLIAVLAGFLLPMVNKARSTGERTKAANHLRQIALAYNLLLNEEYPSGIPSTLNLNEVAARIASTGDLRDPIFFFTSEDPLFAGKTLPKVIFSDIKTQSLDSAFSSTPLSYTFATGIPLQSPGDTPIAWTRGLQSDGTWSNDSPYHGKGGHVAFLDGHVEWYAKTTNAFYHFQTGQLTSNIKDALPVNANILQAIIKK